MEGFYHNILPNLRAIGGFLAIVSSRRNHLTLRHIRLRITNQNHSKHIHILRIESAKVGDLHHLVIAPSLAHIAHRRFWRTILQEELLKTIELPIAAMTFGVVDGSDKIALGSSLDTTLDYFPRCHEIAHGDDAHIMPDRCTQQRGGLLESGDTRQRFDGDISTTFPTHLVDERRHAIDACIA